MAYEILSIKLNELDRRFVRLHRLIQIGESANRDWIHSEAKTYAQKRRARFAINCSAPNPAWWPDCLKHTAKSSR